jgi:class 3 adenylate cyclase/AmiR/NasT family two-component response regulator
LAGIAVHQPPLILIADDNEANREILGRLLEARGYHLVMAADGEAALASARSELPDLVLLDVMMPKLDGFEVCQRLKADKALPFMPIILVTARADSKDIVRGLEAGGDEYVTKPIDQAALVARVRSALRIKELHDTVHEQARRLARQADELAQWNTTLEQRVQDQLVEIERIGRLRRFLSPQIAELVLSSGGEQLLESHRREITALNCDLRGFTGFSEIAEPEEVIQVLRQYHEALGKLIHRFEATLERYAGDGVMVWFNDPLPCPDPCQRAVHMALQMRTQMAEVLAQWRRQGHQLGFSIGIAHGYATLGRIGFEGRFDYAAVGTVVNLAARLCAQAADNQILIDRKVLAVVDPIFLTEPAGEFMLKGLHRLTAAFNVCGVREAETS